MLMYFPHGKISLVTDKRHFSRLTKKIYRAPPSLCLIFCVKFPYFPVRLLPPSSSLFHLQFSANPIFASPISLSLELLLLLPSWFARAKPFSFLFFFLREKWWKIVHFISDIEWFMLNLYVNQILRKETESFHGFL